MKFETFKCNPITTNNIKLHINHTLQIKQQRKLQINIYGNTNLAIMPIVPILYIYEKPE